MGSARLGDGADDDDDDDDRDDDFCRCVQLDVSWEGKGREWFSSFLCKARLEK